VVVIEQTIKVSPLFRFPETIFGLAAASPFSADRFFQPGIDHRASCNFCIFARAENCPLLWQGIAWRIDRRAPLSWRDSYSDRVANSSMVHEVIVEPKSQVAL
jgi:hypothetical protein